MNTILRLLKKAETIKYGGSRLQAYQRLLSRGFYLPHLRSKAVSREYLYKCENGLCPLLRRENMATPPSHFIADITKELYFLELRSLIDNSITLGFTSRALPDKKWLYQLFQNLLPDHPLLKLRAEIENLVVSIDETYDPDYHPTADSETREDITRELDDLLKREKELCDEITRRHSTTTKTLTRHQALQWWVKRIGKYKFLRLQPWVRHLLTTGASSSSLPVEDEEKLLINIKSNQNN